MQRALDDSEALPKPATAGLQGSCVGAGLLLALCCDSRVASERTIFALPEIKQNSPDLQEALAAFLERRSPRYTGT